MRVLHVIPSIDPSDGGPSQAVLMMGRALRQQGIKVDIATTYPSTENIPGTSEWNITTEIAGCKVFHFPRKREFYKVSLPLGEWLNQHVPEYDVVHAHALFSYAPLAAAYAARSHRVPYVMRPLGVLNKWGMTHRRSILKRLSFRWFEKRFLNDAIAVHYTSRQEQIEAESLGLQAHGVIIPLGIDLSIYNNLPKPKRPSKPTVLFLSRLTQKKGIELLLEAAALCQKASASSFTLVLAGDGDAEYVSSLKAKADSLGLSGMISWPGFLEGDAKLAAFAAADLYVLPSYSENFGIALLEAMAAGIPCISTEGVALAQEAAVHDAVHLVPCQAEPLALALQKFLADPAGRKALGKRGKEFARDHYSLEIMGRALADLYREIIDLVSDKGES